MNGEQAYLRKDAAAAFMAMNEESVRRWGVVLRVASARVAYRTLAQQWYFWNLYRAGRGALAAYPGTSNHGWALAVDLATQMMRWIVDQIGAKYGFAKRWSDAPSEWWHIKWREGVWHGRHIKPRRPTLKQGMTGRSVRTLQRLLRHHGFKSVKVSGYFNKATLSAVRRLQKAHKLPADGIVGSKTWHALLH